MTYLFRFCVSLAPVRMPPRKRVTHSATRLFALLLSLVSVNDEQTRHMDRDAFVPRLCVAGSRASGAEQTRHGPCDAFVRFVALLNILSTTDKRVTWSVTRLFRVCASLVPERPTQTKRVTV